MKYEIKKALFCVGKVLLFFLFVFLSAAIPPLKAKTEAGFVLECEDCKNERLKPLTKVSQKFLDIKTCNIVAHKRNLMKGRLSDYWAQELIGSDLLREELEKNAPPEIENWIAVFDTEEEDHNIYVKNLISDEGLHAVLPELGVRRTPFQNTSPGPLKQSDYEKGAGYKPALSLYETGSPGNYLFGFKSRPPHYINNSMGWSKSKDIYEVFQKLSSAKISKPIVVVASGNRFSKRLDDMENKASKDFDAVLAGSFSPKGFVSKFSQSGREVSILAPSDDWITSAGKKGEYVTFGGTSGAAPLVTGSLAGFEWLSGYKPTAEEAKILLEKTAFPTVHSHEKPRLNGAGLLNAYKMGAVAKRLKEKCGGESLRCFKEGISNNENYRFAEDKSLRGDLKRVFPSCAGEEKAGALLKPSDCEERKELFKRLRRELLLSPGRGSLKILSCLYKEAGFSQNAQALNQLSPALGTEAELRAKLKSMLSKKKSVSKEVLRLMLGMGGFEEGFNRFELEKAVKIAGGLGEAGLSVLERGFETGNPELQELVLREAGKMGKAGLEAIAKPPS